MNRADLFAIAAKHGYLPGKPLSPQARKAIDAQVAAKLTAEKLAEAPRIFDVPGGRQVTREEAVSMLLEELSP